MNEKPFIIQANHDSIPGPKSVDGHAATLGTEQDRTDQSIEAYNHFLQRTSLILPEVQAHFPKIKSTGEKLITEYNIRPEFFSDSSRTLALSAIASPQ